MPTEKRAALLNEMAIAILYQRPGDAEGIALLREAIALGDQTGSRLAAIVRQNLAVQIDPQWPDRRRRGRHPGVPQARVRDVPADP
jgi:hypothetical protein